MGDKTRTIFRTVKNKDNPFVMMDKRPLENPLISLKANGLLAYLLSRPDNWKIRMEDLLKRFPDKAFAIRSAISELKKHGHMRRVQVRQGGRVVEWTLEVHEVPLPVQERGKLKVENLDVENQTLNNNKKTSNNEPTTGAPEPTPRVNVFRWYEENIGPLTPVIADVLRDALGLYPDTWIIDAINIAVQHNKRNWKYCVAILNRWKVDGKDDGERPTSTRRFPVQKQAQQGQSFLNEVAEESRGG